MAVALAGTSAVFARTPGATEVRSEPVATDAAGLPDLDAANGLLNRGLYDLAEPEYRRVLAGDVSGPAAQIARYGLAVCLFRLDRCDAAIDELQALAGDSDFDFAAEVGVMLGRCLLRTDRPAEAAAAFKRVGAAHADNKLAPEALAGAVEALYRAGDYAACRAQAETARTRITEKRLRDRTLYFLALAEAAESDHAAAMQTLTALLDGKPEAGLQPSARLLLGRCAAAQGQDTAALSAFQAVADDGPVELAKAADLAAAEVNYRAGNADEADALLERVLSGEAAPDVRTRALVLRGHVRFELGRYADALSAFQSAASVAPDDSDLPYWIAKCNLRLGNAAEATSEFEKLLQAHPDAPTALAAEYDHAVALLNQSRLAEARAALAAFLTEHGQHELAPEALHLATVAAYRDGDDAACLQLCREFQRRYASHKLAADTLLLAVEAADRTEQWENVTTLGTAFLKSHADDPRTADVAFRAGLAARHQGKDEAAEQYLSRLVTSDDVPDRFAPAALALGDIAFQRGAWAAADHWLTRYLASAPRPQAGDDALLKRGIARARLDNPKGAVADFDALLAEWPQSTHVARAQFERGQALMKAGDAAAAESAFAQARTTSADAQLGSLAAYQQAVLALQSGDHDRAIELFTQVIAAGDSTQRSGEALFQRGQCRLATGDAAAAEADFATLIEQYRQHARGDAAHAWRVVALARAGKPQAAIDAYARLDAGTRSRLDGQTKAAALAEYAWALRETKQAAEAAKAYAALLALPDVPANLRSDAELAAAELAIDAEGCPAAHDRLVQLVDSPRHAVSGPVRARALLRLGLCAADAEDWADADDRLGALLKAFPSSPYTCTALLQCGQANLRLGRPTAALEQLQRVVSEFADDPQAASARLRLGECFAALQRWVESERVLDDFLERSPDDPRWYEAQFGIGWARENQERRDEAIAAYRAVVDRHQGPTAARAQFQIGECLFAQGDLDAAARALLKVDILYAYPQWSAAALFEAGRCFEQMNRRAEARTQFEAVIERFEDSQWARAAADRLPRLAEGAVAGH
ncbi:MAG: tetratricopeptide repeat protein [Phycisphaerales bacterium]|nr:tetratricopeptide repeat protein [Phycisphaerales bacterium]